MKISEEKTNAVRFLSQKKVVYNLYSYESSTALSGTVVAEILNKDPKCVFKTLVTVSSTKHYYIFLVPVCKELDLKKAAKIVGEKSISMIKQSELYPLTGYVHGGCSPIGMKKSFPTYINESVKNCSTLVFSGGRIGLQVEVSLSELSKVLNYKTADIIQSE